MLEAIPGLLEHKIHSDLLRLVQRNLQETLLDGIVDVASSGALICTGNGMKLAPFSEFPNEQQRQAIEKNEQTKKAVYAEVRKALESKRLCGAA